MLIYLKSLCRVKKERRHTVIFVTLFLLITDNTCFLLKYKNISVLIYINKKVKFPALTSAGIQELKSKQVMKLSILHIVHCFYTYTSEKRFITDILFCAGACSQTSQYCQ